MKRLTIFLLGLLISGIAQALTVNSLADDASAHDVMPGDGVCLDSFGECTLRAAIEEANADPDTTEIEFSVAGLIVLDGTEGALPEITETVSINAYTAPGANPDSNAPLLGNLPVIELSGAQITRRGGTADGLRFLGGAAGSEVLGLSIINFPDTAITMFADGMVVQGCLIGLDAFETVAANGAGVDVFSNLSVIGMEAVGPNISGRGNAIGGNQGPAVLLRGNENGVNGNIIGLNVAQDSTRANGSGIIIDGSLNEIGVVSSTNQQLGNVITGNDDLAISIRPNNPPAQDNWIRANLIGLNSALQPIGNNQKGVRLHGDSNRLGGGINGFNTIANNTLGIEIPTGAVGIQIENNRIGIRQPQLGNVLGGLRDFGDSSLISGNDVINNQGSGLSLSGTNALVVRNKIGVVILGNDVENHGAGGVGILISNIGNTIGASGDPNIIGFNGGGGILVQPGGANTLIEFNQIGLTDNGLQIGNSNAGISIGGALDVTVRNNLIGFNNGPAVAVPFDAQRAVISDNQMRDNLGLGIDLAGAGANPNDAGDADTGPNQLQNSPEVSQLGFDDAGSPPQLTVEYAVDSDAGNSTYPLSIEFYLADDVSSGEGRQRIFVQSYANPGATGNAIIDLSPLITGGVLVISARDAVGNTSEFSAALPFGRPEQIFSDSLETI